MTQTKIPFQADQDVTKYLQTLKYGTRNKTINTAIRKHAKIKEATK